jgi:hypothetical protein
MRLDWNIQGKISGLTMRMQLEGHTNQVVSHLE